MLRSRRRGNLENSGIRGGVADAPEGVLPSPAGLMFVGTTPNMLLHKFETGIDSYWFNSIVANQGAKLFSQKGQS